MKKWIFAFLVLSAAAHSPLAFAGKETGNGGDPIALEFGQVAQGVLEDVQQHATLFPELGAVDLAEISKSALVIVTNKKLRISTPSTIQESAAENIPVEKTILINRLAWKQMQNANLKRALVFHELLGLAGLEKTGTYPLSTRYLTQVEGLKEGQSFHCQSYAALVKMDGSANPTLATELKAFDISWVQKINGSGVVSVPHHVGGLSYVAWAGISYYPEMTTGSTVNPSEIMVNYVISKTLDAAATTLAQGAFATSDKALPDNFDLPLSNPIKVNAERAVYFDMSCNVF